MFMAQFSPLVRSGAKRQTIRRVPSGRRPQAGDLESWRCWSGKAYRSKTLRLATVRLTEVLPVVITRGGQVVFGSDSLSEAALEAFAQADGFESKAEFFKFFLNNHGLPFEGILIKAANVTLDPIFKKGDYRLTASKTI